MSRLHFVAWMFACILCSGCHTNGDDICPMLIFELRTPQAQKPDPKTRIDLAVEGQGSSGTFLSACTQRVEGASFVFQRDFVLGDERSRMRALIVSPYLPTQAGEQVFLLAIARNPKPRGFTEWQHPNYMAKDAGWAIMYDKKVDIISTNIPPDSFELRYKVEMQNLGPEWNPSMRRKDSK